MKGFLRSLRGAVSAMLLAVPLPSLAAGFWQLPSPEVVSAPMTGGRSGLGPAQIGLIINDRDPYSVAIGAYYQRRRGVPAANVVHVNIATGVSMNRTELDALRKSIYAALLPHVQALALAWVNPSRVECNSITSALARGFVAEPCDTGGNTCDLVETSPYYNSYSTQPYTDFGLRPTMLLAAPSIAAGKALIARGIAADGTQPHGRAYLMATSDTTRSLRANHFANDRVGRALSPFVDAQVVRANAIVNTGDALFYFQGLASVPELETNHFLAGAIADHLTSFGGRLTDSSQMSALHFIAAGATGSYGTVSEPCARAEKFPNPAIAIMKYAQGETLIEAYWKSVAQPFQGVFIGEPLANPWQQGGD